MNQLRKAVRDDLTMRRGLGFKLAKHEGGLQEFVSFLAQKHRSRITANLALEWATLNPHHKPYDWAARLSIVRGFARHWSATDSSTEVPPLGLLPYRPPRAQPYFYSDQEIRALLKAAKNRPSIDPLRPWTYYCLFGLLAVTACGSVRRCIFGLRTWTAPQAFSRFGVPSLESPGWCRCMPRLVRSWQIM